MRVALIGAGPGDKGLLTLKGAERIQNADVVLYDRYVGEEIIAMIPDTAEKIDVGKNAGNHPVPQDMINYLLLDKVKQGLNVVRLKGGDPFVFGRGGEELELLVENGVPFEVVPGVTSAIAGATYAGIPVTHRDFASSIHIITGHAKNNENVNINYDAIVKAGGTLVFLMGTTVINEISTGCIAAGMNKDMPAAIVENATTNAQRKYLGTVGTLPVIARENAIKSPAIIVIGKTCQLSERYDWFSQKPLLGKRIIVARVKPEASQLSDKLRELGCNVLETPCAKIIPLTARGCILETTLKTINDYAWLVFTSSIGVNVFFDYLNEAGFDIRMLYHLKIACVGIETEKEINKRGIKAAFRPTKYSGTALARGLSEMIEYGERLLIVRAKEATETLTEILTDARINFDDVPIYEKTSNYMKITEGNVDYVAFTSSSAVDWFTDAASDVDFNKLKAVCIGERTAAAARSYGMEVFVSKESTMDSMVDKIMELT